MPGLVGTYALTPARWLPSFATVIALALSLIWNEAADARLNGGSSFAGGGGFASLNIGDIVAFNGSLVPAVTQPTYPGGTLGGLFSRGDLIGAFAAGFLGSGVVGLLFGHGVVGELSGVVPVLGLLFQLALIAMLGRLIWTWWHDDKTDALAGLSPRQLADAYGRPRHEAPPKIDDSAQITAALDETQHDAVAKTEQPHS